MSRWAVANWSRWDLFIGTVLSRRVTHTPHILFYHVIHPFVHIDELKTFSDFLKNKSYLLIISKLKAMRNLSMV